MAGHVWTNDLVARVTHDDGEVVVVPLSRLLPALTEKRLTGTLRAIVANPGTSISEVARTREGASASSIYRQTHIDVHALADAGLIDLGATRSGVGGGLRALVGGGSFKVEVVYDLEVAKKPG